MRSANPALNDKSFANFPVIDAAGAMTVRTGSAERLGNMNAFTLAALDFFATKLRSLP